MDKKLPNKFTEKLYSFGEWNYGVNKITVILDDGTKIHDVKVSGLEILKVGYSKKVNFDPGRIIDIIDET